MSPHGNSGTLELCWGLVANPLRTKTLRIKSGPGAPTCTGFSAYRDEIQVILLDEGGETWQAGISCTFCSVRQPYHSSTPISTPLNFRLFRPSLRNYIVWPSYSALAGFPILKRLSFLLVSRKLHDFYLIHLAGATVANDSLLCLRSLAFWTILS